MQPKTPDASHTPGALDAVMQDAANAAPAPSTGEQVPVTVTPPAEQSGAATDSQESSEASAMTPGSMVSPGRGFDLGDTHTIQATTPFTENNPDAAAELNGGPTPIPAPEPESTPTASPAPSALGSASTEVPAVSTTPPAETTTTILASEPKPPVAPSIPAVDKPYVAGPDGKPTGSQVLGEGDTLVVSGPEKQEAQEFEKWVANANDGLRTLLQKESGGNVLTPDEIKRKALYVAVIQADLEQNRN